MGSIASLQTFRLEPGQHTPKWPLVLSLIRVLALPEESNLGDPMSRPTASVTLIAFALLGCATQGPYAEITGEKIGRADSFEEQVLEG